jgi:ankyrin repeat protein
MSEEPSFLDAVTRGDLPALTRLIRARPELVAWSDELGKTGLHHAAEVDQVDPARLLIEAGADIEARTSWNATPLDWAATMGSGAVADLLLSRGAKGYTLITAAALGHLEQVKTMVESTSALAGHAPATRLNGPSHEWPPDSAIRRHDVLSHALYSAARNGHHAVVAWLLERGADRNAKGFFGGTALHWAAINGHATTVELLLASGADPSIRDARFDSSVEGWAEEGGHQEVIEILRRRGA